MIKQPAGLPAVDPQWRFAFLAEYLALDRSVALDHGVSTAIGFADGNLAACLATLGLADTALNG